MMDGLKEIMINGYPIKFCTATRQLAFMKLDFDVSAIIIMMPGSDGEKFHIFCDREKVKISYKHLRLGKIKPNEIIPLNKIIIRGFNEEKRISREYSITDSENKTLMLIFKGETFNRIYVSFSRNGEKIEIESFQPEVKVMTLYI